MTPIDVLKFWQTSADDDWETANVLVAAHKYHHALFFCHLALEKLLKGLVYAKTDGHPLAIHHLVKLALQATVEVSPDREKQLNEITSWNIEARYDNYKREFYLKATKEYTERWMTVAKEIFLWIKSQY